MIEGLASTVEAINIHAYQSRFPLDLFGRRFNSFGKADQDKFQARQSRKIELGKY